MKKIISITLTAVLFATLLTSCGGGLNGTYVPKNNAAKAMPYNKFVFGGSKVKVFMGVMGISMPGSNEYSFSRDGNKISIKLGVAGVSLGGIELEYDENADELRMVFGGATGQSVNEHAPVWGKEGSFDPNAPAEVNPKKNSSIKEKPATIRSKIKSIFGSSSEKEKKEEPVTQEEDDEDEEQAKDNTPAKEKTAPVEVQTQKQPVSEENIQNAAETKKQQKKETDAVTEKSTDPAPTAAQLNALLNKIGNSDAAIDELRNTLGNHLQVVGAANISNVQQLITDVSVNGSHYQVTDVKTDADGEVISITVKK